ncbi:MAG: PPC domain-containing protein [Isosphaeraceae bacterium]
MSSRRTLRNRSVFCLALAVLLATCGEARAQRRRGQGNVYPQPHLQSVFPLGLAVGETTDVTLRGSDLEGVTTLWFDHPGLRAFHLKGLTFRVSCAPGTPQGYHDVRAFGTYGLSNPRAVVVASRPGKLEVEPNNALDKPQDVALGDVIAGEIAALDVDCFAFQGKKDQRVILDLEAERLDSRLDATMHLLDPSGREIAESRDAVGLDPLLDVTLPADGRYVLKVHDVTYKGSTDHPYRLSLSAGPRLDAVVPVVARPGVETKFTLYGRNLGGEVVPGQLIDGRPVERVTVTLTPPALSSLDPSRPTEGLVGSAASPRRGFEATHTTASGRSNPLFVALTDDPVVIEKEPNDGGDQVQTVELPCDISGSFQTPGDMDVYRFRAKKGDVWWIEASAERIGSAADPSFLVQKVGEKGVTSDLGSGEDQPDKGAKARFDTATVDAALRWTAPEDGLYQVAINDLYSSQRGDLWLSYRMQIRPERPDFHVFILPDSPNQPDALTLAAGGRALAYVLVVRTDGLVAPIRVEAVGLPEGVRMDPVTVAPNESLTPVVFEAAPGAKPTAGTVRLKASARYGDRKEALDYVSSATRLGPDLSHEVLAGGIVWPTQNAQAQSSPARLTRGFAVGVSGEAPLAVTARPDVAEVTPGGLLALDLSVARKAGFNEAVTVTLTDPPQGLAPPPPPLTIAKTADTGTFAMTVPTGLRPGIYTVVLQAAGPYPFSKDPNAKTKPNVNLTEPTNRVSLVVRPSPAAVTVNAAGGGNLKAGGSLDVEVKITPKEGAKGPFEVSLAAPPALKLKAGTASAEAGKPVKLSVSAAADAPVGAAAGVAVRVKVPVQGSTVEVLQPLALTIAK